MFKHHIGLGYYLSGGGYNPHIGEHFSPEWGVLSPKNLAHRANSHASWLARDSDRGPSHFYPMPGSNDKIWGYHSSSSRMRLEFSEELLTIGAYSPSFLGANEPYWETEVSWEGEVTSYLATCDVTRDLEAEARQEVSTQQEHLMHKWGLNKGDLGLTEGISPYGVDGKPLPWLEMSYREVELEGGDALREYSRDDPRYYFEGALRDALRDGWDLTGFVHIWDKVQGYSLMDLAKLKG